MKRFVAFLWTAVLMMPCFAVTAFAADYVSSGNFCDVCLPTHEEPAEHCSVYCTGDSYDSCDCGGTIVEWCTATHNYDTLIMTTPGTTCQDGGTEVWQCDCGATTIYPGSTTGEHAWDSGEIDATDGVIRYACTVCGETKAEAYAPGHTHSYVKTVTAPTCTSRGFTHYKCSCGDAYYGDYTDMIDHNYVVTVYPPTCTSVGYTLKVCSMCQDTVRTDEKPVTDHAWVPDGAVTGPTCSTSGELHVLERNVDVASVKAVPENAGFAEISEIGGMTYKDGDVLRSAPVTKVESIDTDGTVIGTLTIPAEVQALDGYGWGVNESVYNYIDWEKRQFVKRVQKIVFDGTESWNLHSVNANGIANFYFSGLVDAASSYGLCNLFEFNRSLIADATGDGFLISSKVTVYFRTENYFTVDSWKSYLADQYANGNPLTFVYVINTPITTDISDILPVDNLLAVDGGTLTFVNEYGYGVPSEVVFYEEPYSCDAGHYYNSKDICTLCGHVKEYRKQSMVCSTCGETKVAILPDLEHDYNVTVVAPTCTSIGYTRHVCTVCGATYADEYVAQLGHNWGNRVEDLAAGKIYYTCLDCGEVQAQSYNPGHAHEYTITVTPPTCLKQGYTHYKCSCGYAYYDDFLPAMGHQYETIVIAPTCEESGYTLYVCSVCEHSYKDNVVSPLGHVKKTSTTAPTCTAEGFTTEVCDRCGDWWIVDRVPALGHNLINGVCTRCQYSSTCIHTYKETVYAPTCEGQGYTVYTCTKCGDSIAGDYKDPLGHDLKQTGKIAAKCEKDGYIEYTCARADCGHIAYETLPMLGHKWSALWAKVTGDQMSVVTYECSVCKQRKTETVMTAAAQAQNWLLTSIRGATQGLIDMYETVANGVEVGGVTVGEVLSGTLIIVCFLFLLFVLLKLLHG